MASGKAKINIMEVKEKLLLNPIIEPYEIVLIVNYAWERSFSRVATNKKAIAKRGWHPFN